MRKHTFRMVVPIFFALTAILQAKLSSTGNNGRRHR